MIQPSIGRVVWFQPSKPPEEALQEQPWAAIVTYVHNDRLVNLSTFNPQGGQDGKMSVMLLQDNDPAPDAGYFAQWMPYQVAQAEKEVTATSLVNAAINNLQTPEPSRTPAEEQAPSGSEPSPDKTE